MSCNNWWQYQLLFCSKILPSFTSTRKVNCLLVMKITFCDNWQEKKLVGLQSYFDFPEMGPCCLKILKDLISQSPSSEKNPWTSLVTTFLSLSLTQANQPRGIVTLYPIKLFYQNKQYHHRGYLLNTSRFLTSFNYIQLLTVYHCL